MKKSIREKYLIANKIGYFKNFDGVISVNINDIPTDVLKKYNQFNYQLQKENING